MKKKFKSLAVLVLVVLLTLTTVGATVISSGTCGEKITWALDDTGTLTVGGTGEMESKLIQWQQSLDSMSGSVKKLIIQSGVTGVGYGGFSGLSALTSVVIPDSVTTIDYCGFSDCNSLTNIPACKNVKNIGYYAFSRCLGFRDVTIPNCVENIDGWAFSQCTNLNSIHIPNSIVSIGDGAFADCTNLASIIIPEKVQSIGHSVFNSCKNLKSIYITVSVKTIKEYAFYYCDTLTDVYYEGSEEQWKQITIENKESSNGELLFSATIHYNSKAPNSNTVTDKPSDWAKTEIDAAVAAGIIPEHFLKNYTMPTTRADYCALATALYEMIKGEIKELKSFVDTNDINVSKMAAIGVVNGVGNDRFDPDAKLTREQAATVLSRLASTLGKPFASTNPNFGDKAAISAYAIEAVGQVQSAGIMSGVGNNIFSPKTDYTRQQSIITMKRLFDFVVKK